MWYYGRLNANVKGLVGYIIHLNDMMRSILSRIRTTLRLFATSITKKQLIFFVSSIRNSATEIRLSSGVHDLFEFRAVSSLVLQKEAFKETKFCITNQIRCDAFLSVTLGG